MHPHSTNPTTQDSEAEADVYIAEAELRCGSILVRLRDNIKEAPDQRRREADYSVIKNDIDAIVGIVSAQNREIERLRTLATLLVNELPISTEILEAYVAARNHLAPSKVTLNDENPFIRENRQAVYEDADEWIREYRQELRESKQEANP